MLANVERIELEALAVERAIAGRDVRLEGTVRLTTVESLAAEVLSPILAAFRLSQPLVQVEVAATTRSLSLTKREADVALRVVPFTQSDLVVRRVGELSYGLYAAPGYLERRGMPDWAAGAEGHDLILTEPDLLDTPEMAWVRGLAPRAGVALMTDSRILQRAAARDGLGIAALARYLGDGQPGLVRLAAPGTPVRDLFLGVHGDMRHTPRIRAFTDTVQDGLKRAAGRLHPAD